MDKRYCPMCHRELCIGQRTIGGSRESERKFALRKFCSIRCSMAAQVRKQRAKHQTGQERLQAAWDACPDLMEAEIVWRPFDAWYAVPLYPRHLGDEGEYLGPRYDDALDAIRFLAGVTA